MFKPVASNINFPQLEEEILKYWKENKIFEKSVEFRPQDKKWTFLDGPPFITGMPHYGTLLVSIAKDLFPRFWTMKGYRVRRVWGWDCHGLPAENKVETQLNLKSKREIEEKVGIKKFIEECKLYVSEVSGEWEWYIDHIARWVDFKNAYKTMDLSYMESVMWVFKQMYDKGYIYKGLKVSLYCPHCATPISNFEVAMDADNHKEILDAATIYKYQLKDKHNTYILAWSTTPWNKIVTPALAVNPDLIYVKVKQEDEYYILAKSTLEVLRKEKKYEIVEEIKGQELVGLNFEPHYDYYKKNLKPGEKAFVIIGGDFVTAEEGTGVVTIAAYGEEDLVAMQKEGVHLEMHLDEEGMIKSDVPTFGGMYYLKANKAVNEDLAKRGLIYKDEELPHNVPLCWRCHTRLYYAPINAWYVNVQDLKPLLKKTNEEVNWFPKHFKYGRFLKSLENAPDWNISRNRYWGSPVPVWECDLSAAGCGERFVPGSITELEEASGQKITDLHKPEIDQVTVVCPKCKKTMHRVPEVLDSWIEAGSASFAERHFPFDKKWKLEDFFPPDFIVEYTGQIRAWFYVLHVIGGALYESPAFKNVGVTGVLLGTDGRKMSKNFGNYPDPKEMLEKYGGDALRLYLMGSSVMHGEDLAISEEQYRNQVRGMMLILWNVYNFFVTYANLDNWEPRSQSDPGQVTNVLDKWILMLLQRLLTNVTRDLNNYNTALAVTEIKKFVNDLSLWYIRRSRERVGPAAEDLDDKEAFYNTCFYVLTTLCKILAPITPFLAEYIYRGLLNEESVHLADWPQLARIPLAEPGLLSDMQLVRKIVEMGLAERKKHSIKVKQPLNNLTVLSKEEICLATDLQKLILSELNLKKIVFKKNQNTDLEVELDTHLTEELIAEGKARELIRKIQEERKKINARLDEVVDVIVPECPQEYLETIKKRALVREIVQGENFAVKRL